MGNELQHCVLCPRRCGVDRSAGEVGFCKQPSDRIQIARAALHMWEEPCISGENGSGTVFFCGCTMRCCYCQNRELWNKKTETNVSVERLSEIFIRLQKQGAHNINLVSPTPYVYQIIQAVKLAKHDGLNVPIVYNTGGYETTETIRLLKDTVDIYLTDFKYGNDTLAEKYSGTPDYFQNVSQALATMVATAGRPKFNKSGIMTRGVIVRHLVLPGEMENTKQVLRYISDNFGSTVVLSLMQQYTPLEKLPFRNLRRRVSFFEYNSLCRYAKELGFTTGYFQHRRTSSKSFIPKFDETGIKNMERKI